MVFLRALILGARHEVEDLAFLRSTDTAEEHKAPTSPKSAASLGVTALPPQIPLHSAFFPLPSALLPSVLFCYPDSLHESENYAERQTAVVQYCGWDQRS